MSCPTIPFDKAIQTMMAVGSTIGIRMSRMMADPSAIHADPETSRMVSEKVEATIDAAIKSGTFAPDIAGAWQRWWLSRLTAFTVEAAVRVDRRLMDELASISGRMALAMHEPFRRRVVANARRLSKA